MSFQHYPLIAPPAPLIERCFSAHNKKLTHYEKSKRMALCIGCSKEALKENKLLPHARYKNMLSKNTWNKILHQVQNNKERNSDSFDVLQTKKFLSIDRCRVADSSSAGY